MKTITISGMHCEACQKLITMELDDAGLKAAIKGFRQIDNNTGELDLVSDASNQDVQKMIEVISEMDGYTVKSNL